MKKLLLLALLIGNVAAINAQSQKESKDTTVNIDVSKATTFTIDGKKYSVADFKKAHPILLPAELWPLVITIIDKRSYGDLPASQILQLLQIIGQQLPQDKK